MTGVEFVSLHGVALDCDEDHTILKKYHSSGIGWNASAVSAPLLEGGDCWLKGISFSPVGTDRSFMVGLSSESLRATDGYSCIDFAVCCEAGGRLSIFEAGVWQGTHGTYDLGDRVEVTISDCVEYRVNGALRYKGGSPVFPLCARLCANHAGPFLVDLSWVRPKPVHRWPEITLDDVKWITHPKKKHAEGYFSAEPWMLEQQLSTLPVFK